MTSPGTRKRNEIESNNKFADAIFNDGMSSNIAPIPMEKPEDSNIIAIANEINQSPKPPLA